MRRGLLSFAALLSACHQQQPKLSDEQMRAVRTTAPGMTEYCLNKIKWGGIEAMPNRSDECYKFEAPKQWKGVWINQFEGSQFCPDAVERTCPKNRTTYADDTWLDFAGTPPVTLGRGGVYAVQFVGRRSIGAGHFGHMGMSRNDIIVDRVISMKQLEPPPPPLTRAQEQALEKKCEFDPDCWTASEIAALGHGESPPGSPTRRN